MESDRLFSQLEELGASVESNLLSYLKGYYAQRSTPIRTSPSALSKVIPKSASISIKARKEDKETTVFILSGEFLKEDQVISKSYMVKNKSLESSLENPEVKNKIINSVTEYFRDFFLENVV